MLKEEALRAELGRTEYLTAENGYEGGGCSIDGAGDGVESQDGESVQGLAGVVVACKEGSKLSEQAEAEKRLCRNDLSLGEPREEEPCQAGQEGTTNSENGELEVRDSHLRHCHVDSELETTKHYKGRNEAEEEQEVELEELQRRLCLVVSLPDLLW